MDRKTFLCPRTVCAVMLAVFGAQVAGANSATVSYQGVLRDAALAPISDGTYQMRFSIFNVASGGAAVWGPETQPVTTRNGMFSVYLGSSPAFGTVFADNAALWLQVEADTGSGFEVYGPRVPLASVPYAQHARSAWSVKGNAAAGTDFIGTTNAQPWIVKTNNAERLRVQADGKVGIGVTSAGAKLDVGGLAENESGFRIIDSLGENHVFMVPKVGPGGYNPLTQADDAGIFFKDVAGLMIAPWTGNVGQAMRVSATGAVDIGTSPVASAILDVASTTQGFAMPRMTTAQRRAIAAPVDGLQVYDTNLKGYYYFDGAKWDCVSTPAGTVAYFARDVAPNGWLECRGQTVSNATFPELFAAIQYRYGGSGANFVIPDLRGEFIRGWDNGRGADAQPGGRNFGTWQAQDWKSITFRGDPGIGYAHELYMGKNVGGYAGGYFFMGKWETTSNSVRMYWDGSEIRPRNVALMPCIKF